MHFEIASVPETRDARIGGPLRHGKLDFALMLSCYSNTPEMKEALVGESGYFKGCTGYYDPRLGIDYGEWLSGVKDKIEKTNMKSKRGHR